MNSVRDQSGSPYGDTTTPRSPFSPFSPLSIGDERHRNLADSLANYGELQELRFYSRSIKQEILKVQENYTEQFSQLGKKLIELSNAAENYHAVLTENRKLFNELQELKGNIRVFCRVRPFLPGQGTPNTVVEHVGEDGELVVTNPTRQGKDGLRQFRFNKVYSPNATQAEVFSDIKPLVRSVLDGFNVCIFAYGQTGSGKTYTMTGPDGASEEDWGVNYRALNDLFKISQSRKGNINYDVGVQMVEIYNEQVLDLLSDDRILSTTSENGLAVPDASMYPVTSTLDVITLMDIGLENRSVGATAMNERSSRSHSIVTVHVRGKDMKTGSVLYGNLHLVDLAGSERVDRSEVKGDRLREAQHINKSLSSLGDVIFSLASKSSHIPYRNSKLTQLLQSSLGGRAKTLMFVQLNPDATSYSESMSTLKFAERVSGVELGAAKSSKEGKDARDLMEQVVSLKDTIARKDEEIERLHHSNRLQKPMVRRKSFGQTDDMNSETGEYSSQSRHSVTDGESLSSSVEAEYEERLSEVTSDASSIGTQRSTDVAKRPPKIADRAKSMTSRSTTSVTRPLDKLRKVATRTTSTVAKVASGLSSSARKKLIELSNAAENYHAVLTENRKLFNELQELKGNIRVFCRVRPFLPGQGTPNTVVEHVGEDGELVVTNPTRQGKDGLRQFRFNKVYSPNATQGEVFSDIKPLVRSVLDGFNVCIFAYGQTGSGKTYTMTGPDGASEEDWGVNYRALNDLFKISQSRKGNINYEVGVQMVEIYNEQVLDLLSDDISQKKYPLFQLLVLNYTLFLFFLSFLVVFLFTLTLHTLGILSATSENGLAVPDASMYPVTSTSDVITLMDIGLQNRSVGATAMNERSSRSHSIVTVHVRGKDMKTGSVLYGNLHLVDLAGSERVDRSEVKGDRLREAQHINKSLSSLGDVIFSLASKSSHIPYRNSKLTQLLQSSLGGRAKTLMFVQLNPDTTSYSESMSTLKFAERVSGVELGAAKSSKEGKDARDLMEQVASLKDTIARKDEEIERLHHSKRLQKPMVRRKSFGQTDDMNSETGEYSSQSRHSVTDGESLSSSVEAEYEERLSEVTSDASSIGTQRSTDVAKRPPKIADRAKSMTSRTTTTVTRPLDKLRKVATRTTSTVAKVASGLSSSASIKKTGSSSSLAKSSKRWA
ncbi:hypothetical protein F2Q69_00051528 [Brassica cretica]|uniref:Kinesin motor domain-containing protein n=1 Tax=Brassica cretica TaxID=69181 RepID=A0A8S9PIA8_BRACR|nr:hypothetical protein F2Q69_00051528 [Brassica cretica]